MKSMTGFAKEHCVLADKKITIEIKTLNSKQMDANVKLPFAYRERDLEIRSMLNRLERGKVDFLISEEVGTESESQLNSELLECRYRELQAVAAKLHCSDNGLLEVLVAQSDIWSSKAETEMSDSDWEILSAAISRAIDQVDAFRLHEGTILEQDFAKHVDLIEQKLHEIPQYESERIDTAKQRIKKYFDEFAIKDIDQNRFEQELIYYLEKLDITEEKVRLQKHIDYFRHTVANESSCGKKLAFIAQEMGREINTTGSKANHVEMQRLVVEMKDELEKIKEQLGNIL